MQARAGEKSARRAVIISFRDMRDGRAGDFRNRVSREAILLTIRTGTTRAELAEDDDADITRHFPRREEEETFAPAQPRLGQLASKKISRVARSSRRYRHVGVLLIRRRPSRLLFPTPIRARYCFRWLRVEYYRATRQPLLPHECFFTTHAAAEGARRRRRFDFAMLIAFMLQPATLSWRDLRSVTPPHYLEEGRRCCYHFLGAREHATPRRAPPRMLEMTTTATRRRHAAPPSRRFRHAAA